MAYATIDFLKKAIDQTIRCTNTNYRHTVVKKLLERLSYYTNNN